MRSYTIRHYILLIHGIAGKKEDFGSLVPALMTNLNLKGDQKYIVRPWCYNSSDDDVTTLEFAQDLVNSVANLNLQKGDRLSFITHSQGSLIFHLWLAQQVEKNEKKLLNQLDFFIALAPPYWGTKIAEFGVTVKRLAASAGISLPLPFGNKQLKELSYGSESIYQLRQQIQKKIYSNLRILTVAGKAQMMNILAPFTAGTTEFEDDSAVPVSSTRCGFYYTSTNKFFNKLTLKDQQKIEHGTYLIVDALHLSPGPSKFYGIAQITDECITSATPQHPSYLHIENFILEKSSSVFQNDFSKCSSFLIDIHISLTQELVGEKVDLNFYNLDGSELKSDEITLSRFLEPYSKGQGPTKSGTTFYYTGSITKEPLTGKIKEHNLLLKIKIPSQPEREIEFMVQATYSSFIDILLSPKGS